MSPLMKTIILWALVILVISYLFNLDIIAIVTSIIHAAQTVHNTHK